VITGTDSCSALGCRSSARVAVVTMMRCRRDRARALAPGSMPAVPRISCRHKKAVTGEAGALRSVTASCFDRCPRMGS
jgi:hypothetical protein